MSGSSPDENPVHQLIVNGQHEQPAVDYQQSTPVDTLLKVGSVSSNDGKHDRFNDRYKLDFI